MRNISNFRTLHRKILRDVKADFLSSCAIVLLVAITVGSYTAPMAGWMGLSENINHVYEKYNFEDVHVHLLRPMSERSLETIISAADREILDQIWFNLRLVIDVSFLLNDIEGITYNKWRLRLIGINLTERHLYQQDPSSHLFINDVFIFHGKMLNVDAINTSRIVLDHRIAKDYNISLGSELPIVLPTSTNESTSLEVMGLGSNPEYVIPMATLADLGASSKRFGIAFISLKTLQRLTSYHGDVNDVCVKLKKGATVTRDDVAKYFWKLFEKNQVLVLPPYTRERQMSNYILLTQLHSLHQLGTAYPTFLLIIGSFGVYLTASRRVLHQKRFMGIMMASGYTRRDVIVHFLEYMIILGLIGSLIGTLGGWMLSYPVIELYARRLAIPTLILTFPLVLTLVAASVGLLTVMLAALLPAWRLAKLTPRECLQNPPQLSITNVSASKMERLIRFFPLGMNLSLTLALRNVRRSRGRAVAIALAMTFTLALFISSRSFLDSGIHAISSTQSPEFIPWDAKIQFYDNFPVTSNLLQEFHSIKGIDRVELVMELPVVIMGMNASNSQEDIHSKVEELFNLPNHISGTKDRSNDHDESLYLIVTARNASLTKPNLVLGNFSPDGVVITQQFARNHDLNVGDQIMVLLPKITWKDFFGLKIPVNVTYQNVTMTISGLARGFFTVVAYMDFETFRLKTGLGSVQLYNSAYITFAPGADKSEVREFVVNAIPSVRSVEFKEEFQERFWDLLDFMETVVSVLSFFSMLLGIMLVTSAIMITIVERKREIGIMQALGTTRRFIFGLILIESLINSILGILLGLGLGYVLGWYFITLIGTNLFFLQHYTSLASMGVSVMIAFFIVLTSSGITCLVICKQPFSQLHE